MSSTSLLGTKRGPTGGRGWTTRKCVVKDLVSRSKPSKTHVQEAWPTLKKAIHAIHTAMAVPERLETLYRTAESCSRTPAGAKFLYDHILEECKEWIRDSVAGPLAEAVNQKTSLSDASRSDSPVFLKSVYEAWEKHGRDSMLIRNVFIYLDRTYVIQNGLPLIWDSLLGYFCMYVFSSTVSARIVQELLVLLEKDRKNEKVDMFLCRKMISMMCLLRVYENAFEGPFVQASQAFYAQKSKEWFDELAMMVGHDGSVTSNDGSMTTQGTSFFSELLKRAHRILTVEAERVDTYLMPSTRVPLISACEKVIIQDHLESWMQGLGGLLDEQKFDDVTKLYHLCCRVGRVIESAPIDVEEMELARAEQERRKAVFVGRDGGTPSTRQARHAGKGSDSGTCVHKGRESLRDAYKAYVVRVGESIVNPGSEEGDKRMVDRMLAFKKRMDKACTVGFCGDSLFVYAEKEAMEACMNSRALAPAEYIAKYVDALMRSGRQESSDDEFDSLLDSLLHIFRYIEGKDVFEAFYKKALAKRLLLLKSASLDAEKAMIAKLKGECGAHFTSKLEGMFHDISLSKELSGSFNALCQRLLEGAVGEEEVGVEEMQVEEGDEEDKADKEEKAQKEREKTKETNALIKKHLVQHPGKLDLYVNVLTSSNWPTYSHVECQLPPFLLARQDAFAAFYVAKFQGRVLSWQHALGVTNVTCRFPSGERDIQMSLFQAVVCLLFNDPPPGQEAEYTIQGKTGVVWTFKELLEKTRIPREELVPTMQSLSLAKVRVLRKSTPKVAACNDTDKFAFNASFKSNLVKLKLNQIQVKESKGDNEKTRVGVFQDRQYQVDAAIVRIMKTKKSLPHQQLINQLLSQLTFPMQPADVKKRIESLIDRDFIERDAESPNVYLYVA